MMPLHELIFAILCVVACIYAAMRGGAPERIIACGFIAAFFLTRAVQSPQDNIYVDIEWGIAAVDGLLLGLIGAVALTSTRYWSLPMASLQVIDVLGHIAKALDPAIIPRAYYFLVVGVSYPMPVLLAAGVWFHRERLLRYGRDHAWVMDLPTSYRAGAPWHDEPTDLDHHF